MFLTNVLLFTIIFVLVFSIFHQKDSEVVDFFFCIGMSLIITFVITGVFYFVFSIFK
jgi:hypothetical protein